MNTYTKAAGDDNVTAIAKVIGNTAGSSFVQPTGIVMHPVNWLASRLVRDAPVRSPLTEREWEILDFFCQGKDTKQIAETLVLLEKTVYTHSKNVLRKLNVHSRREAVEAAQRLRVPV